MEFAPILPPRRRAECIAKGFWRDRTINDEFDACLAICPDKPALTAVRLDGASHRFTYRELGDLVGRAVAGLVRLGIGRGDVVAAQLPNGWQFTVLYLACARIGAVYNPLMPIFRERELSFMLGLAEARLFVVPQRFRGFDYAGMARRLAPDLPALQRVVVVDEGGPDDFDAVLLASGATDAPAPSPAPSAFRPHADEVTQLLYTSGTTGEPKGAMHTANTLLANVVPYAQRVALGDGDVILMASPMAHQTGFMYGLMMPIVLRAHAVLLDIWEPAQAAALIRAEGVTFTMASTPFLADLARVVVESGEGVPSLKTFLCAGAPIPGPLVERARAVLGAKIVSAWGMTENGAVTLTRLDDDDALSCTTDGCPLPGVEIRVVDGAGVTLPAGEPGRLLVRASSNFVGYLKRPQWYATDAAGWFETGDLACIDANGYVRITGRSKDVIIRGGENIPVIEVEALLYRHPAIAQIAIVAYPDERLGERACAVVVPKPGAAIDFAAMVAFLKAQKLALQYIPERLIIRESLPATPSGKIQKFRLRDMLRDGTI